MIVFIVKLHSGVGATHTGRGRGGRKHRQALNKTRGKVSARTAGRGPLRGAGTRCNDRPATIIPGPGHRPGRAGQLLSRTVNVTPPAPPRFRADDAGGHTQNRAPGANDPFETGANRTARIRPPTYR
ncbi:hypothetical protein GCM10023176_46140 [Micromonospora coerulea]|uniref:Uncharacterized protein n=1 Tax=Micromonospora coerulea TaxID=47856 RepID=A0ABP8SUB7_9ACTN